MQTVQYRTRIKICGLTTPDQAVAAVRAGADAIGLVFYPPSPRALSPERARAVRDAVPAFVSVVSLFVNADPQTVHTVLREVRPDLLQFHGDETPEACAVYGHRYIRAFRLGGPGLETPEEVLETCRRYQDAAAWLFDSHSPGYGGSGNRFDLGLLEAVVNAPDARPVILSGGLSASNVARAVRAIQPYAVDVSSGVETAPGVKSADRIREFVAAVASGPLQ